MGSTCASASSRSTRARVSRASRRGPPRPLPLVGALHAAQARHRRRAHGPARAARARRRVLHAPRAYRRRRAQPRAAARDRRHLHDFARDTADISDRQNIQYHWIRVEDVPEIWRRLEAVGLQTTEACGDTPRVVLGSPVAGVARTRSSTRRRSSTRSSGATSATRSWPTCPASSRRRSPATRASTSSTRSTTSRSSASCTPSSAPATTCGSAAASRRAPGSPSASASSSARGGGRRVARRHPDLPRLRLPPAAHQGPPQVPARRVGPREVPPGARDRVPRSRPARRAPRPPRPPGPGDHVGVHLQKDGNGSTSVRRPVVGRDQRRRSSTGLADLVERASAPTACGSPRTRSSSSSTCPRHGRATGSSPASRSSGSPRRPARSAGTTMACTGIEFCKLAIVETKATARRPSSPTLEERLADVIEQLDTPISLHVNGCPNSCARIQTADIGLKGQSSPRRRRRAGARLPGAPRWRPRLRRARRGRPRPHGPRPQGHRRRPARLRRARHAPLPRPARAGDETFAAWAHRADEEAADDRRPPCTRAVHRRRPEAELGRSSPRPTRRWRRPRARVDRRRGRGLGGLPLRRHARRGLLDGRRRPAAPRLAARARRRRALPRDRLPLRRDPRHARQRRRRAAVTVVDVLPELHRRRAGRRVRPAPARPRPGPVLRRCARSSRWRARSAATRRGSPACAATRRPTRAETPLVVLGREERPRQDQPARRLDLRRRHRRTPASTGVRSTSLLSDGYPSIGCAPCTRRVAPGEDPRAGRWAGFAKTECGIHT